MSLSDSTMLFTLIGIREYRLKMCSGKKTSQFSVYMRREGQVYTFTLCNTLGGACFTSVVPTDEPNPTDIARDLYFWIPKTENVQVFLDVSQFYGNLWTTKGEKIAWFNRCPCDPDQNSLADFDKQFFVHREPVFLSTLYVITGGTQTFIDTFINPKLKIYNTDSARLIPRDITKYDAVIVGTKFPGHFERIQQLVSCNLTVDAISVSLADTSKSQ